MFERIYVGGIVGVVCGLLIKHFVCPETLSHLKCTYYLHSYPYHHHFHLYNDMI